MSDEQRVRTMCGWIGVEISKSRVRTPGRAGYGLYRVRGWRMGCGLGSATCSRPPSCGACVAYPRPPGMSEWTAYAFTLDEIERAVDGAIWEGTPSGPAVLRLRRGIPDGLGGYEPDKFALVTVPTRWTQAYRGRRDLGVGVPVRVRPEYAAELDALVALVDAGLIEMRHVGDGWCSCRGTAVITAACARLTTGESREVKRETVRSRQREANAAFQRSHVQRRAVGLERRQARKLSLPKRQDGAAQA